tara:strand:+ start:1487 stop:1669 length:183 start_codon:yes stop_codon:yes gene_type:complete
MTWKELRDFLNTMDQRTLEQAVMAYDADSGRFMLDCDLMDQVDDELISPDSLFLSCSMGE